MSRRTLEQNLAALDTADPPDVCIIGSGPAGATLGADLAERGIRTFILESGNSLIDWFRDDRLKRLAEYESHGDARYPVERTTSRIIGGNSNFWTGRCERFHPSDFEPHPYTPPDNPWPLKYRDLEADYYRAEQTLRVRGGPLSEYAPPRESPLPLPPRPDISALKRRMKRAGLVLDDSPTATPRSGLRFFRVHKEILPRFLASKHGTLISGLTVTRLHHDHSGAITAAEARTLDGAVRTVRARLFVVACGGIQTPRLLLLSRSERFPHGIGNDYDRVGRGFNEHPSLNFYGTLRADRSALSLKHAIGRTHQLYETCRGEGLGAIHAVVIQSWVFPNHLLRYRLVDVPRHLIRILSRAVRPTLYMSPTLEMRPVDENRITLSPSRTDPFGDPIARLTLNFSEDDRRLMNRSRELCMQQLRKAGAVDIDEIEQTWSRHHLGACRMGHSPKTSVVDPDLRVHPCPNLYLCGSEVFVTGAAVQPVLTIGSLAHRLARHLARRLERESLRADTFAA